MKKFFKAFNIFEICYLLIANVGLLIASIFAHSSWITIITVLFGVTAVILNSKGNIFCSIFSLISDIFYIVSAYYQAYYGEIIIYVFLMIPLCIITFFQWLKHRSDESKTTVKVQPNLNAKSWISLISITLVLTTGIFFLLRVLHTENLLFSTISIGTSIFAFTLMILRSQYCFVVYLINDIVLLCLWITPVIKGDFAILPMVLEFACFLISDIYGIFNWSRLIKTQNKFEYIG